MIRKLSIALLMGGDSGEYDVSIGSAKVVAGFLDKELFDVYPVLIRKNDWHYALNEVELIQVDKNDFSIQLKEKKIKFDCAFIAIHGTPGEDGKLQGYLDLMGIPYTSCDLTTSALTFNKFFCNDIAIRAGMNVAKTLLLREGHTWSQEQLANEVGLPCFIKPNKSGSSVGVTKVYNLEDFEPALKLAFSADDEVQVQQFIKGREMACGVFRKDGRLVVLPVTEIIPKNDFFDYEAKYTSGMAEEVTPADITPAEDDECRKMTAMLYEKFNCKGVVRFDYFLSEGKWWFLEVNTVPGFSEGSIIPKQAKAAGMSLSEFFSSLVYEAIRGENSK
jgi:D-alanine-D-alanine ligase